MPVPQSRGGTSARCLQLCGGGVVAIQHAALAPTNNQSL
jgi:hypothetical protein